MSRPIDFSKCKDAFINSIRVGEMWFQGVMLYVKKRAPKVTIKATISTEKPSHIVLTAQFVDYEHRYRYADEINHATTNTTHGIAVSKNRSFTSITSSGVTRINFTEYSDTGMFRYSDGTGLYGGRTTPLYIKAWIAYVDPETGRTKIAYSNELAGITYNSLKNGT